MAKQPKATATRVAATVTARYYPTAGAADGFYLDGRLSGRREQRAADITLDREDRGFFYAVYARLSGGEPDPALADQVRDSLDKIKKEIKEEGSDIDSEINELAECAISVVGRIALKNDGMRQPYFAGILVRDAEMAAVTMGGGLAYLYRGDALYPLTNDEFALEPVDYLGKKVPNFDMYCAGVAGTVRYSNIAQLQLDDCLIVCNRELMEALGQREILRMLYEAHDQADAAGMIITAASAKLPGTPLQITIGFVENIVSLEKTARLSLGRNTGDTLPLFGGFSSGGGKQDLFSGRNRQSTADTPAAELPPAEPKDMPDLMYTEPKQTTSQIPDYEPSFDEQDDGYEDDDIFGDDIDINGTGRKIAFYIVIAAICLACIFLIYHMLSGGKKTPKETTAPTVQTEAVTPTPTESEQEPGQTTQSVEQTTSAEETQESKETEQTQGPTTEAGTGDDQILAYHTVAAGETPWSIAVKYYNDGSLATKILDASNIHYDLVNGQIANVVIKVGDELVIPVLTD